MFRDQEFDIVERGHVHSGLDMSPFYSARVSIRGQAPSAICYLISLFY